MSGPWEDYASDGPWNDYAAPIDLKAQNPAEYDASSPEYQRRYGMTQSEVNKGSLAAGFLAIPRGLIKGALSIPTLAADTGVAIRNKIGGTSFSNASDMLNEWLEKSGYGRANSIPETVTEFAAGAIGGLATPTPSVKNPAPPGFTGPVNPRLQVLQEAQAEGYRVPPATTNPTAANKIREGIAGKLTTAQAASAKNQGVTNRLAARALGLPEDQPITTEAINQVRQQAGQAYEAVKAAGRLTADKQYADDLAQIGAKYRGAAKDFPEIAKSEVTDAVEFMSKSEFDADSAIDVVKILRDKSDAAYGSGNKSVGKAYRELAKAAEDVIERNLASRGKDASGILKAYRAARQLIAKTYTVERALNVSTGNVAAPKIAARLAKGEPLSEELRQVGQFAQAFPKAAREFNESLPGISPLDFYGAGGVAAASGNPAPLLYPFTRQGMRSYLLSASGNKLAVPATQQPRNMLLARGLIGGIQSVR